MATTTYIEADLMVQMGAYRYKIVGHANRLFLVFPNPGSLWPILKMTRRKGNHEIIAREVSNVLSRMGITLYLQNRLLPVAGAKPTTEAEYSASVGRRC